MSMQQPVIETERLILREFLPEDANRFYAMDSLPEVHRYLGNKPVTSLEQIQEVIRFVRQQYLDNGIGRWSVIEKSSGNFIGWSGLKLMKESMNDHIDFYDVGYRFHPDAWGKGYATESAGAALQYAFTQLQLPVVYGITHIGNTGSRHVLEKCGLHFVNEFEHEVARCNWFEITMDEWHKKNSRVF